MGGVGQGNNDDPPGQGSFPVTVEPVGEMEGYLLPGISNWAEGDGDVPGARRREDSIQARAAESVGSDGARVWAPAESRVELRSTSGERGEGDVREERRSGCADGNRLKLGSRREAARSNEPREEVFRPPSGDATGAEESAG